MAMNIAQVKTSATEAVLNELTKMYKNSDKEGMRQFAEAIAEAAVVAVQHVIDKGEVRTTGQQIY